MARQYPAYKDSGTAWLGSVPVTWAVAPLGKHFLQRKETVSDIDFAPLSVTMQGIVPQLDTAAKTDNGDNRKRVEPGDFVINSRSDRKGSAGVSRLRGSVSVISIVLKPRAVDPGFAHHLLRSEPFQEEFYRFGSGIVADLWSTRYSSMKQITLAIPPSDEQLEIARYLDNHTSKLDLLIGKQERLLETLAERRQAVISHGVTNGLDLGVSTVDGGEWLGRVPSTWVASRLKRVAAVQTGLTLGKEVALDDAVELPYLRVANVQTGGVNLDEVKTVVVARSDVVRHSLRDGDVLMTEGGDIDKLGRGCLWRGEVSPCLHQNHVFAVRCSALIDSRFLVYLLDARVARSYFRLTAKKTTNLASTNSTTLGNLPIALPLLNEQRRIVGHLDREIAQIDTLATKAREMIDVLKERRQALISAAVTGKIDVRGLS